MSIEETSEGGDSKGLRELVWESQNGTLSTRSGKLPAYGSGNKGSRVGKSKFSTSGGGVAASANFRVTRANAATWWPVRDTAGGQGGRRHACAACLPRAKSLQACPVLCNPMECSPTRFFCPWDSLGRNTGVGCHALLQGIFRAQGSNPHLVHLLH